MPELTLIELVLWPALVAGFGWHFAGRGVALRVFLGAAALLALALWALSPEGGANRLMLAGLGRVALWTAILAVPVGGYAWIIAKARRTAAERDGL